MEERSAPTSAPGMGAATEAGGVAAIKAAALLDDAEQLVQLDTSFQTSLRGLNWRRA